MSDPAAKEVDTGSEAPRYQPLVIVLAGAAAGIAADRFRPLPLCAWWAAAACAWLAWLVLWRRRRDAAAALAVLVAVAALGGAWHHLRWSAFGTDKLGWFARDEGQPVCVEALARAGPRRVPAPPFDPMRIVPTGDRTRLEVDLLGIRDGVEWRSASGRATLRVEGHLLGVHAGDRLRIFAQLAAPRRPANPGAFDYARYARADRTLALLSANYPDCVMVAEPGAWGPWRLVEQIRSDGNRLLWRYLDHEQSGLAAAVLLGVREELSPDQTDAFVETGTIHLLAISGLHVGMLVLALSWALRLAMVSQHRAVVVVAVVTVLYALVTDARPPAVRATILVLVVSAAYLLGRRPLSFNSLAAAGLVVLALNPADLFRVGAQLSFLAVAGLAWFAPAWVGAQDRRDPLERLIAESRGWLERAVRAVGRFVWQLTLVSLTIWLLSLPLVMARFHLLTPVALGINVVLWIPMLVALASGFGVLVFGWVFPPLAVPLGFCCDRSLALLEWSIGAARDMPGSHTWVPGPEGWWLWGFYGGVALLAAFPRLRPPRRWCVGLLALWVTVGFAASRPSGRAMAAAGLRNAGPRLDCTFLSVGHGCAVVLHLPDGRTMLCDAGGMGPPVVGARTVAGYLWSRGIVHLDAVVLTHADADHYNALPELLRRVSVGVVYVSPVMFEREGESAALSTLRREIERRGVPIREIRAPDRLSAGKECRIEVLHPPRRGVLGSDNANSLVLAIEYQQRRILLTGDIEPPGLNDVLAEEPWDCDVLLVPHHGSRQSNPAGLAEWCRPEWVVLSAGQGSDSRPTEAAYEAAGSRVLHTGRDGAVSVSVAEGDLTVTAFREPGGA